MTAPDVVPPGRQRARAQLPVWFGLLGGPLAWAIHLGFSYLLVPSACASSVGWLHLVTAVSLVIGGWALWTAAAVRRRARRGDREHGPAERNEFLGLVGTATSALFLAVTLMEGLQPFLIDPCL